MWQEKVNAEDFKAEILEGLVFFYSRVNVKFNSRLYPKVWEKRESYLPSIKLRLVDIPRGLYLMIYKDLMRHEMAIAYEDHGVVYEALIGNLDSYLNLRLPTAYNVYYLVVYNEGSYDIIKTKLFPKNRKHIYIPCGFLARCMPEGIFKVVWDALKKFSII